MLECSQFVTEMLLINQKYSLLAIDNWRVIAVMIMIEDVSNDLESGGEKHFRERWLQYL